MLSQNRVMWLLRRRIEYGQLPLSQLHSLKRNMVCMSFDCSGCFKPQCTKAERRFPKRHLDEEALTRMNARANLELTTRRRCAADHPFGIIKRMMGG